ncbi:MAG TPA: TIGR02588 family protein [Gammaproteobacteria bacterium]
MTKARAGGSLNGHSHRRYDPPFWEKCVAAVGLLMLCALLAYLIHQAVSGDESPPEILVAVREIRESGDHYLVVFEARNDGGKTAQAVLIVGELRRWGVVVESAEATLDFVPAGSVRHGGLFFTRDPEASDLRLRASGYSLP